MRRRVASGTCFLAECALRPGTLAVDALIQASVARVYGEPVANDAMLFVGDRDGAIPDGVIQDATLEPVDKIVWMVIKRYATDGGSCSTFSELRGDLPAREHRVEDHHRALCRDFADHPMAVALRPGPRAV